MVLEPGDPIKAVERYLASRPRLVRWREWLAGRRYLATHFGGCAWPVVVIAGQFRDRARAEVLQRALTVDWTEAAPSCRDTYDEILLRAPHLIVIQLRRTNLCGCLGHRHVLVHEAPFTLPHDALGAETAGEMDIAYERVKTWLALPLSDTALDAKFLEGSRLDDFHAEQLRLRLLSVVLHEINHLVYPQEPENSVRERSIGFYRDALAGYVDRAISTLSLTIDRSFSRFG